MKKIILIVFVFAWGFILNNLAITHYKNYEKFHIMISPEANYFPTIDEAIKNLNLQENSQKKFVIIGGSSASAGSGQSYSSLWSTQLQNKLGESYKVINSAMNGGSFSETGLYQAKYLAENGYKVVYVFDGPPTGGLTVNSRWAAVVMNACFKGYEKNYELCYSYIKNLWKDGQEKFIFKYLIDTIFPNQNFWNYISYNFFQFQYHPYLSGEKLLASRKKYGVIEEKNIAINDCFRQFTQKQLDYDFNLLKSYKNSYCFEKDGECDKSSIQKAVNNTFLDFPEILKGKTIATLSQSTPFYHDQLSASDFRLINQAWAMAAESMREIGVYGYPEYSTEWQKCDFGDRVHWTDEGASRHALHVRNALKEIGF